MKKNVHHHLQQKNETLEEILNSLAEGVIVSDQDGKFLFFNPVAEKILGVGSKNVDPEKWQSVYGCYMSDKITPYPSAQLPLARAIRNEKIENEVLFIQNPERPEGIFINVNANPLKDNNGTIKGGTIIFQDITESKFSEMELKQSEERIKAQFKGFPIPTYIWQKEQDDFILIDYNNSAENITQGGIQKYLGSNLEEMYKNTPYLHDIQNDFMQCLKAKTTVKREMQYRLQTTGEYKEFIVSYVFVPPNLILVHTEDITERKHAEEQMKKLTNAVEQTADSVVITNKQGVIEYVNPAFETTTGYSRDEVIGKTPSILKSGKHDNTLYHKLWDMILNGKTFRDTIINKKKNGNLYWCEQTITPMKDSEGQITHFVSVIKDITELKKKQEQEIRLRIAHELQQQLLKAKISEPGFDIAGVTYSAVETSGDYFDFIAMRDGYIGIVIGDVSGHGIGSALIMAETRAYLRAFAKVESDPGKILTMLNNELVADLDEKHFVTLILARLDPRRKVLDYASAGHVPAYLLNSNGEVIQTMPSTGIPLGFLPDFKFDKSQPIKLSPEDIMVFLTDGVSEAHGHDDVQFGYNRVFDVIKNHRHSKAQQIVEHLYQAVHSFSNNQPQQDDITSVICKVNSID